MYIVHRGVAEAVKRDEYGNKVPLRLVQEGESFLTEGVLSKVTAVNRVCRYFVDAFSLVILLFWVN